MSVAIFGWIRIRRIERVSPSRAQQWISNRRWLWERRLDCFGAWLAEPEITE